MVCSVAFVAVYDARAASTAGIVCRHPTTAHARRWRTLNHYHRRQSKAGTRSVKCSIARMATSGDANRGRTKFSPRHRVPNSVSELVRVHHILLNPTRRRLRKRYVVRGVPGARAHGDQVSFWSFRRERALTADPPNARPRGDTLTEPESTRHRVRAAPWSAGPSGRG